MVLVLFHDCSFKVSGVPRVTSAHEVGKGLLCGADTLVRRFSPGLPTLRRKTKGTFESGGQECPPHTRSAAVTIVAADFYHFMGKVS